MLLNDFSKLFLLQWATLYREESLGGFIEGLFIFFVIFLIIFLEFVLFIYVCSFVRVFIVVFYWFFENLKYYK